MARRTPTRKRTPPRQAADDQLAIPVVQETLEIGKVSQETGRLRVRIAPKTRVERIQMPLMTEHVEVRRVPINRVVDAPTPVRQEGDLTIIPVFEEVLTVEKKLVLKEEVHIKRQRTTKRETRQVPVRSEEVKIARTS